MRQEEHDDAVVYLGLQGFCIESVRIERAPKPLDPARRIKVVGVVHSGAWHLCPSCGKRHQRGLFSEHVAVRFRDCSIGDFETYLEIRAMRVLCCGGTRVERLPFATAGFRMTERFFSRVAALCTRLPIRAVAEMAGLSWDTVARVDKRAIELALEEPEERLRGLRWIGVDEVSRTGGRVYFTIVTNLETGKVVWVGDGKGEKGLSPFLQALGEKGRRRIRGAVSDLGYQSVINAQLPKAAHVLDRFHIVQWMNEALNQVRRRLFSAAPKEEVGRTLKVTKWLLVSARQRLRHKDKLLLTRLMEINTPLYKAYLLKEQLRAILQYPWRYLGVLRRRLGDWIDAATTAGLDEVAVVARRLAPHVDAVIAGHEHQLKLGLVEAINSKIAALRVQARGYRDPEYFKLKIFQRCGLETNPWASIVL